MVRIFHGSSSTVMSLDSLHQMSPNDVIQQITQKPATENTFLSRHGRPLSADCSLSTVITSDDDMIRIVQKEVDESLATTSNPSGSADVVQCTKQSRKFFGDIIRVQRSGNPVMYRNYQEVTQSPTFLRDKLKKYPQLRNFPQVMAMLSDPQLVLSTLDHGDENQRFNAANPILMEVVRDMLLEIVSKYSAEMGQALLAGGSAPLPGLLPMPGMPAGGPQAPVAPAPANPITADMLSQAIAFAMGGGAPGGASGGAPPARAAQPPARPAVVDPLASLRAQYGAMCAQLIEFGFTDESQNLQVLASVGGSIDQALELLISMREADEMD